MLNILWVLMIAGGILFASFHGTTGKLTEVFISSSTEAVNLCIFMLGVIGVWNGMMEIAVKIHKFTASVEDEIKTSVNFPVVP